MIQMQHSIRRARERLKPEPQPEPVAQRSPTPDRHPEATFVDEQVAWDHRFLSWTGRQIVTPRRTVRLLSWALAKLVYFYSKPRGVVVTLASRKVTVEAFVERQAICDGCPENDDGYCLACKCPRWPIAKLGRKNRHTKWYCPLMKHPGAYPKYACPGCGQRQQNAPTASGRPNTPPMPQRPVGDATGGAAGVQASKLGCGRGPNGAIIPQRSAESR